MRIEKTALLGQYPVIFAPKNNENKPQNSHPQIKDYNPPSYRDFNINFGARLFRTPANFFEFNQNRLPATMKEYLNDDFEDRQNMPPVQMWKTVFEDLKNAGDFEEVKKLYPEEPLFSDLKNYDGKAKDTVIGQIQALSDEFKTIPLFKDGSSDFGMYLLKKIYFDGKFVTEINKDFQNDINDEYKGLIDKEITNNTTRSYGIKFPNVGFWNSFIVTREDFPYVYKPRKELASRSSQPAARKEPVSLFEKPKEEPARPKKFGKVKDWEINKLTDAMVRGRGSKQETQKRLKNTHVTNGESLNFVAKYMGEINSIVLDRLHISDEMSDFFENYEDLNKTQQQKFEQYWKNSDLNRLQAILMSDTIKLFFNAYGADGNNEEFSALLDYAHGIKPQRLAAQKAHEEKQAEYDRELGIFDELAEAAKTETLPANEIEDDDNYDKLNEYQKLLDKAKAEYNAESFDFVTEAGKITIVANLQETFKETLQKHTKILPKVFANKFINYTMQQPEVTKPYILSLLLESKDIKIPQDDDRIMPQDMLENTTTQIYRSFLNKYAPECRLAKQPLVDAFIAIEGKDITPKLFSLNIFEFPQLFAKLPEQTQKEFLAKADLINQKYKEYSRPLTSNETYKVLLNLKDLLRNYDPNKSILRNSPDFKGLSDTINKVKISVAFNEVVKTEFEKELLRYIPEYGGTARFLFDKKMPETLRMAKFEDFMLEYCIDKGREDGILH